LGLDLCHSNGKSQHAAKKVISPGIISPSRGLSFGAHNVTLGPFHLLQIPRVVSWLLQTLCQTVYPLLALQVLASRWIGRQKRPGQHGAGHVSVPLPGC
jgi:hypothetical protein